jgi:alanyl-tRNA synthetase
VVVLGRARAIGADLKMLVPGLLERAGGKGGGSPDLVQVSAADPEAARAAFRWAQTEVPRAVEAAR